MYIDAKERNLFWTHPGRVKVGDRVKFERGDGQVKWDTVRMLFEYEALLEPYARNTRRPAAVLTEHSWCYLEDIREVEHGSA